MQRTRFWKSLGRPLAMGAALGLAALLLPLLAVGKAEGPALLPAEPTAAVTPSPLPTAEAAAWDGAQPVKILLEDGTVAELTMADYLWRVVAAEMPASFEPEALAAQAVCARTYSLWKLRAGSHRGSGADLCSDSRCCQAYIEPAEAAERWGALAEAYTAKIAAAVAETDGQALTYGGEIIQAVFFSSSAGQTEDAAAVWGSSLPYLVPVDSPEGDEVPNYHTTVTLTADEVRALAATEHPDAVLAGDPAGWITDVSYTASGRVAELSFGGVTLSGGAARNLFGLRSASFTVEEADGVFTFSVTGYGHGVGMSQYGANAMAKEGSGWRDIVEHYYTGVTVERMDAAQ